MRTGRPKIEPNERKLTISVMIDQNVFDSFCELDVPNKSELINELLTEHFTALNTFNYVTQTADSADSLKEAVEIMKSIVRKA